MSLAQPTATADDGVTGDHAATTVAPATAIAGDTRWYAVWTRSQYEPKVAHALARKRLEVFLPCVRVPSARRDRARVLERPLFPGYLFVRFAATRYGCVRVASTDGVVRILGDGWDALHPIADAHVEAVRRIIGEVGARPLPWVRVGDRVRIVAGPLAGLEGTVQASHDGRTTFVVSVDLLQRSVGVEVEAEVVERV